MRPRAWWDHYQMDALNCWGTNFEPPRSASVNPKTKNWLGLGMVFPSASVVVSRKSLSLAIQRVW